MSRVLFIGSNPSCKSDVNSAFDKSTGSGRTLHSWIDRANISDFAFANVSDDKTPNNRPLRVSEIKKNVPRLREKIRGYEHVVAVGKTAETALDMIGIEFFRLEHPSGLNRKLNDAKYVELMIKSLSLFITE